MKVSLAAVLFPEAAVQWLESRRPYLSAKAYRRYGFYLKPLTAFFAEMKLGEITADQIRAYQRARAAQAEASTINHECSLLQQMLKRVGRWPEIGPDYQPLPLPKSECGRALTDAEYTRLFRAAASNPHWLPALLFMTLSINTTAGPGEVLSLRLADLDLGSRTLRIPLQGAKDPERARLIWLNDYALAAAGEAQARAEKLGAREPAHYLFPYRPKTGKYDPGKPQTTFRRAWREICAAADIQNFRMYDLRHHAITTLLENPKVSEQTAEAIAGHISARMKKRYSHIRLEYKKKALAALAPPWKARTKKAG